MRFGWRPWWRGEGMHRTDRAEYDVCHTGEAGEKELLPVDHLALPLTGNHVQQRLPEVVPDAAVADHLVPEDDEAQVVHVLYVVLLHIHAVLGVVRGGGAYVSNATTWDQSRHRLDGKDTASLWPAAKLVGGAKLLTMYMRMSLIITMAVWWSFHAWFNVCRKLLLREFKTSSRTCSGGRDHGDHMTTEDH